MEGLAIRDAAEPTSFYVFDFFALDFLAGQVPGDRTPGLIFCMARAGGEKPQQPSHDPGPLEETWFIAVCRNRNRPLIFFLHGSCP